MNLRLTALLALREWRHHPWRHGAALMAVALGVALAFSVHLIHASALAEFGAAVRAVNGQPDLSLRGQRFNDALFERVAADPAVQIASPVLEIDTYALAADGRRVALRVMAQDALLAATLAPELLPLPRNGEVRLAFIDPDAVFINATLAQALGGEPTSAPRVLKLQSGPNFVSLREAGSVAASGQALAVMDLAGAQQHFDALGQLSRIDLRLLPGSDQAALLKRLALPAGVRAAQPDEAQQRVSQVSRAYRVNLSVLALVALFVGSFLVFSVLSLSVAQRAPALALLGVLGMSARQRRFNVLAESAALGLAGAVLGLALGTALAALALRLLAGDLGGGFFPGVVPALEWSAIGALVHGLLGLLSALAGAWWPARQAERLRPAQALKGLGNLPGTAPPAWPGLALLALGAALAWVPAIAGLPLAAYAAVAALLLGGVALIPSAVHALLSLLPPQRQALPLLAVARARFQRQTATAAVAGVVSSLALAVALTVMVASFRDGVSVWLDSILPADLYARSAASSSAADQAWLAPETVALMARQPGVLRLQAGRSLALQLTPGQPSVTLLARPLADPASALPLLAPPLPAQAGETGVFVSEAVIALHGARVGGWMELPLQGGMQLVRVRGVWRDYARQFGSIAIADTDYQRLTGDKRINELSLWLAPGADMAQVQAGLRALLAEPGMIDFASSAELRRLSLRIFDRSFAVTYYLQAVAIAIGLIGIAASLSAQVLARRKEFGLLSHLGLTRGQVIAVVTFEAAAWVATGVLLGLGLGVAVSAVLVYVVNPQSFYWSMDLVLPWLRLAALSAAVLAAGVASAALCARQAASRQAVMSVKEDW